MMSIKPTANFFAVGLFFSLKNKGVYFFGKNRYLHTGGINLENQGIYSLIAICAVATAVECEVNTKLYTLHKEA